VSGQIRPRVNRRAAFTLLEVLLAVAVLGFVSLLFVNGASDLFRSTELRADDIFWQGVSSSRQLALDSDRTVSLTYNAEKHLLVWAAGQDAPRSLAFPGKLLEFLPAVSQGSVLIGGQLAETGEVKVVRFYADGGCDAFRAQLTDAAGHRQVLSIDPWTCAPVIPAVAK
jgi:prepilin-type N-terminal cleavage/methylation domain-containing protein